MTSSIRRLLALAVGLMVLVGGAAPMASAQPAGPSTRAVADSNAAADLVGIDRSPAEAIVANAINPAGFVCAPTDFTACVAGLSRALSPTERNLLAAYPQILDIATFDAILFATPGDPRYQLRADYRHSITATFTSLQRFWDIPSADIQLVSMHGSVLQDTARVARVLQVPIPGFGLTPAAAQQAAAEISSGARAGLFGGGTNPLLTLNAFAFTPALYPFPPMQGVPDKIILVPELVRQDDPGADVSHAQRVEHVDDAVAQEHLPPWAGVVGDTGRPGGGPALAFDALFEKELPILVAPDAGVRRP